MKMKSNEIIMNNEMKMWNNNNNEIIMKIMNNEMNMAMNNEIMKRIIIIIME
jgi:hypothetical protein